MTADAADCDKTYRPPCFAPTNGTTTHIVAGDVVTRYVEDGAHTVTRVEGSVFKGSGI